MCLFESRKGAKDSIATIIKDIVRMICNDVANEHRKQWRGCLDFVCAHSLLCLVFMNYIKLRSHARYPTGLRRAKAECFCSADSRREDLDSGILEGICLEGGDLVEIEDSDQDIENKYFNSKDEDSDHEFSDGARQARKLVKTK